MIMKAYGLAAEGAASLLAWRSLYPYGPTCNLVFTAENKSPDVIYPAF
jgi:hypothetical protein